MSNSTNQTVASMRVVPVAGQDSMLMNLSGAHGPYFTRNIVILEDSNGRTVIGEVPGGEPIRTTLDAASELVIESKVANYRTTLNLIGKKFSHLDSGRICARPLRTKSFVGRSGWRRNLPLHPCHRTSNDSTPHFRTRSSRYPC